MTTLSLPMVDTLPTDACKQRALSQWYTPAWLAEKLVDWADVDGKTVLEPSCGQGALLKHIVPRAKSVVAIDIDPDNVALCAGHGYDARCGDYLTTLARADIAVMNPPYEHGLDARFVAKAVRECGEVVALVRLAFLAGLQRRELVWSKVELVSLAILSERPDFGGEHGAKTDFIAVRVRAPGDPNAEHFPSIEWWTR